MFVGKSIYSFYRYRCNPKNMDSKCKIHTTLLKQATDELLTHLRQRKARKRHKIGFETEFLLLNDDGSVSAKADEIIKAGEKARLNYPIHKEYTHNTIEISSAANVKVTKIAKSWLETMAGIIKISKAKKVRIFPYGIYFGTHIPIPRTDRYYRMSEILTGSERDKYISGHVHGFHLHYCLPYGVFNKKTKNLKSLFRSKYKDQLFDLYNALIALDPGVSNFMESSPFLDGVHIAKDIRLILYRSLKIKKDGKTFKGLYYDHPIFGELPPYINSIFDLNLLIEKRYEMWKDMINEKHPKYMDIVKSRHPLQFCWGPIRINRVGTIEYRGMDINLPTVMLGTSLLIKYFLKRVKTEELTVVPSDIGIKDPFKIEGSLLYVPPYRYITDVLQVKSALNGFGDDQITKYTSHICKFALKLVPQTKDPSIKRIKKMLCDRKTVSDKILDKVQKSGYSINEKLDEYFARELALDAAEELEKEVDSLLEKELAIDLEE